MSQEVHIVVIVVAAVAFGFVLLRVFNRNLDRKLERNQDRSQNPAPSANSKRSGGRGVTQGCGGHSGEGGISPGSGHFALIGLPDEEDAVAGYEEVVGGQVSSSIKTSGARAGWRESESSPAAVKSCYSDDSSSSSGGDPGGDGGD